MSSQKLVLLLITTTIVLITIIGAAITQNNKVRIIANLHGKIIPRTLETIDINLGNITVGEKFRTENYTIVLPLEKEQNVTIWLGDKGWCSFGVFEHFNLSGIIIQGENKRNISSDLAHSNLHIYNCSAGTEIIFSIEGKVGYPRIVELEPLSLNNLHLVLFTEN